jgi:hypothetical protein
MGINLSDPPWRMGEEDDLPKAFAAAVSYLSEKFYLDKEQVNNLMSRVSFER